MAHAPATSVHSTEMNKACNCCRDPAKAIVPERLLALAQALCAPGSSSSQWAFGSTCQCSDTHKAQQAQRRRGCSPVTTSETTVATMKPTMTARMARNTTTTTTKADPAPTPAATIRFYYQDSKHYRSHTMSTILNTMPPPTPPP